MWHSLRRLTSTSTTLATGCLFEFFLIASVYIYVYICPRSGRPTPPGSGGPPPPPIWVWGWAPPSPVALGVGQINIVPPGSNAMDDVEMKGPQWHSGAPVAQELLELRNPGTPTHKKTYFFLVLCIRAYKSHTYKTPHNFHES